MTSPLHHDHNEDIVVESYDTDEEALFTACLDIQLEEPTFYLKYDKAIREYISERILNH